jgi:hypothetical protein
MKLFLTFNKSSQDIYLQFAVEIITRLFKQYLIQTIAPLTPNICHFVILLLHEE